MPAAWNEKTSAFAMDLLIAVAQGNAQKVKELLAAEPSLASGARDTRSGATALHIAAQRGHAEIVADLLACAGDVHARDAQGATPLIASASGGTASHVAIARMILGAGADVDACDVGGLRALHEAAECGDERMLRLLLDGGALPNAQAHSTGATALHILVASGGETSFGASWTEAERRGEAARLGRGTGPRRRLSPQHVEEAVPEHPSAPQN